MEKVLVSIEVPAIKQKFDVFIPACLKIRDLVVLLADAVEELSEHLYVSSGHELLCHKQRLYIFHQERTFEDYKVMNGDDLLLI